MKYIGVIFENGETTAWGYSPKFTAAAENDALRDNRVVEYKTGFNNVADALSWANSK